jgi:recombination protein RecT
MAKQTPYTQSGQALQTQQANTPNAIIQRHKAFLDARMKQISDWVREGVRPEALVRFTLMDMSKNAKLRECDPSSIYLGLLACAVTGLEPGALKGEAYLVPFAKQAVFIPGWKGIVKQARRSREIKGLVANVVREADVFDLDQGTANTLIHKPLLRGQRGDVIGAYAIAQMASGHNEIEWMDRDDLDAIQKVAESRGKSPAWHDWPDQMQRKSVIRRLGKRLPLGSDYYIGMALEQAHDEGRPQSEVLDIETDGAASNAEAQVERAPQPEEAAEDESGYAFDPEAT